VNLSAIPSLSSSALHVLQSGFTKLNKAAQEMTSAVGGDTPSEGAETQGASMEDPLVSGVRDLLAARLDVRVGSLLLREYNRDQGRLFDAVG
jgi:hypothetical protein